MEYLLHLQKQLFQDQQGRIWILQSNLDPYSDPDPQHWKKKVILFVFFRGESGIPGLKGGEGEKGEPGRSGEQGQTGRKGEMVHMHSIAIDK